MSELDQLYLGDLHVGQRFTSGSYVMEAARIKEFAAEFDPQPFHLDETAAEASILKGLITPSRSKPHQGIVTVRGTMFNQNQEAVYVLTAKLLVSRRTNGK